MSTKQKFHDFFSAHPVGKGYSVYSCIAKDIKQLPNGQVIYLIAICSVAQFRERALKCGISVDHLKECSPDDWVYKYGRTCNLIRRMSEHARKFRMFTEKVYLIQYYRVIGDGTNIPAQRKAAAQMEKRLKCTYLK